MSRTFLDSLLIEKKSRRQFIFFFTPGGGVGMTNEKAGTDHVISGQMRGLKKKTAPNGTKTHTHTQTDMATI